MDEKSSTCLLWCDREEQGSVCSIRETRLERIQYLVEPRIIVVVSNDAVCKLLKTSNQLSVGQIAPCLLQYQVWSTSIADAQTFILFHSIPHFWRIFFKDQPEVGFSSQLIVHTPNVYRRNSRFYVCSDREHYSLPGPTGQSHLEEQSYFYW